MISFIATIEINDQDIELEISYNVIGSFRQETMENPAECPEIDVTELKVLGNFSEIEKVKIIDDLMGFDYDKVETLCWENEESFSNIYHQPEPLN